MKRTGPFRLPRPGTDHFGALTESILYQQLADDEIIARLSVVRGIGRWTAEMFLIFQLRRLDVWPVDDYGIRQGYSIAYGLPDLLTPKQLQAKGERFRPYRTVAAWYCWQAVHEQRKG